MDSHTENYIILKPIAERFNKMAKEISDEDIKYIIKEAMREQIKGIFNFEKLQEFTDEYIEQNKDDIKEMLSESISDRLTFR